MVDRLSTMQRECVRCCQEGMTNEEIAARLGIATETVKGHLAVAYKKLGAGQYGSPRTVAAVMLYCHEHQTHAGRLLREGE
jgi:DNA-binding NarL/FixJ family response regulator